MGDSHPLVAIGVDVGGTKTQVITEDAAGTTTDLVVPSAHWRSGALFSDPDNLDRLVDLVHGRGEVTAQSVLVAGIHDCDTDEQMRLVAEALRTGLGCQVTVVNDAHLLRYTTAHRATIEMIVGTGAIVSGTTADGSRITADGHGWPIGDRGSAPDLVHAAVRATLEAADRGEDDSDVLYRRVRAAFGAAGAAELAACARADLTPAVWGRHAAEVFESLTEGSEVARGIVDDAAQILAEEVVGLRSRGATGTTVVVGGGVMVGQPGYQAALRARLAALDPAIQVVVARMPPAAGALALARELAGPGSLRGVGATR
jgi:N-acetylglucosamine kinase-like BadF-type ATPase